MVFVVYNSVALSVVGIGNAYLRHTAECRWLYLGKKTASHGRHDATTAKRIASNATRKPGREAHGISKECKQHTRKCLHCAILAQEQSEELQAGEV